MSMKISILFTGVEAATNKLLNFDKNLDNAFYKAVYKGALDVERDAKKECPVDTGRLRSSITHTEPTKKKRDWTATVGSNVEYAPHIEFGTRPHLAPVGEEWASKHGFPNTKFIFVSGKPQPFLYPALSKNFNTIKNAIKQAIRGV